ncbi:hypothetical protein N7457_004993 [Penicillium paradoxum]|uniref:uncharacterized protein n=1 Tax=Penicillium paradoxum TaxID=176176 RepID=UPI0025499E8F|nr:uncharacterized protein N7457_004993 [Penicillium paradoxum]KAJ5783219.1 hypothetical protein N7457_004993 [Penicillium paradoxum]
MRLLSIFGIATLSLSGISTALIIEGEPDVNASLVQQHLRNREKLIALEKTHRQDHFFRQSLSPTAKRADEIVQAIRQDEIDNYWRVAGSPDGEDERFAGEVFPLARPYISNTTLWRVVKRMPKGALLHAHLSAMLPYEKIMEIIINTEGMVMSASQPLDTEEAQQNATITFAHNNDTLTTDQSRIDTADYIPDSEIPVKTAAANFEGGKAGFIEFIKSKTTILPEDSIRHELGVDEIWRRFQACFGPTDTMIAYEPVVRKFYQTLFEDLAVDGINWVEIRSGGSSGKLVHEGDEDVDPDLDAWWHVLVEEIDKFKATEIGKNFLGVRIIWSDARIKNRAAITKSMKIALERKQNFPELFSGYDLVAQEDLGRPLSDLAPELVWFREQTEALNLTIPYFFHAGETLGDGNSTDNNLFDAVLFNTRRIGHGFSLYKHPNLIRQVIEQNVMIEVCPISNEVLRLNEDILHHPLPAMIAHGIPTAISNDDPAILGQDAAGLSYDFYQTIQAFDNIGLAGLGALAQNSLRWANFEDQSDKDWVQDIDRGEHGTGIKAKHIQGWNKDWEEFCQWIVDEYGSKYQTVEID